MHLQTELLLGVLSYSSRRDLANLCAVNSRFNAMIVRSFPTTPFHVFKFVSLNARQDVPDCCIEDQSVDLSWEQALSALQSMSIRCAVIKMNVPSAEKSALAFIERLRHYRHLWQSRILWIYYSGKPQPRVHAGLYTNFAEGANTLMISTWGAEYVQPLDYPDFAECKCLKLGWLITWTGQDVVNRLLQYGSRQKLSVYADSRDLQKVLELLGLLKQSFLSADNPTRYELRVEYYEMHGLTDSVIEEQTQTLINKYTDERLTIGVVNEMDEFEKETRMIACSRQTHNHQMHR